MPTTYNVYDQIYFHFTVYQGDEETPLSGETQSDFTYSLLRNTTTVAVPPVTIAECGTSGTYYALIIPTQTGTYQFRVIGDNDSIRQWHTFDFIVVGATSGLYIMERILKNRLSITESSGVYYQNVWNDSGTSILMRWRLYDKDGLDTVLSGRGPASRGVPSAA
jgi:hypothetical protein